MVGRLGFAMSENLTELNLIQLRKALQQAVLPAEEQIARLKDFCVADEVADDVGHWVGWVLQWPDATLTDDQRSRLVELDSLLDRMSGKQNAHLWTDEALQSRPEWDEVRRMARHALELFGWPIEDTDVPTDERAMLQQALRVAALPAHQQIASFPKGTPIPDSIAGHFFNWSGSLIRHADSAITDEQRSALRALDARLNEISEKHESDQELWSEEGLRRRPEWEEVRRDARKALQLFDWPFEENLDLRLGTQ